MFSSYLHLKYLEQCLHIVETQAIFVKRMTISLAASVALWGVYVRVDLKKDLGYQIIAPKSSVLTISQKPFGKCNCCSIFRFLQSTAPYSLLADFMQNVHYKEHSKLCQ